MAVRKQAAKKPTRRAAPKTAPGRRSAKTSQLALPGAKTTVSGDIRDYSMLLYARSGWGKTTFFASFPDVLLLSADPPPKGLSVYSFNHEHGGVVDWETLLAAIKLLEDCDQFANVCIDTADEALRLCTNYVCKLQGLRHPHDANDYGKTWTLLADEFCAALKRIQQTGRGLYMTAHDSERAIDSASGKQKYTRIGPQLSGQAGKRVLGFVDFILYGDYMMVGGEERRVARTSGSDLITAKHRKIADGRNLPLYVALPKDERQDYELFAAAFRGEDVGVDVEQLSAAKDSGKTMARQVLDDKNKSRLGKEV
jgi:hypothetical protein